MSVVLTVFAVATLTLLYVPLVFVTVRDSVPSTPLSEKLLAASVAVSFPSYPLVGSLTIDAVSDFLFTVNELLPLLPANIESPAKLAATPVGYVPAAIPARLTLVSVATPLEFVVAVGP